MAPGLGGATTGDFLTSFEHRSASTVNSVAPTSRYGRSEVSQYRPGPPRNPLAVTGPTYVGNRCAKCGRPGHRATTCVRPHEAWKSDQPFFVLNEMSHGRLPLPL